MAQVELRATKTFYNKGKFTIAGETFKVDEHLVTTYVTRKLAERVEGETPNLADAEAGQPVYEEMTVIQLREIAKEKGVTGYYNMSKTELIDAIRQAEEGAEA